MNEMIESAYLTLQIIFEYQETQRLINLLVFFFSGHLFLNCFIEIQYYYFYFYLQFNYPYFDQILPLFVAIYLFGFFKLHFLRGSLPLQEAGKITLLIVSHFVILFPNLLFDFSSQRE